jgi:hypothetical protein
VYHQLCRQRWGRIPTIFTVPGRCEDRVNVRRETHQRQVELVVDTVARYDSKQALFGKEALVLYRGGRCAERNPNPPTPSGFHDRAWTDDDATTFSQLSDETVDRQTDRRELRHIAQFRTLALSHICSRWEGLSLSRNGLLPHAGLTLLILPAERKQRFYLGDNFEFIYHIRHN